MSLPRLTRALRAFAGVSPKLSDQSDDNDDLIVKQRCQLERQFKNTVSWSHLSMLVQSGVSSERKACIDKLQQLLNTARELGIWFLVFH